MKKTKPRSKVLVKTTPILLQSVHILLWKFIILLPKKWHLFEMRIYNCGGVNSPSFTSAHLKQLNDQSVVTTRRLLTEHRFSHLTNQQMVNIFILIYPAERPISRNQVRQLCRIYRIKSEDVKYIHLLISRWLPYYQIET